MPSSVSRLATPRVSSPPMATSASTPSPARVSRIASTPPSSLYGLVRDEPRMVPPRDRMSVDVVQAERPGEPLDRALPAVAEADELVAVGVDPLGHDRPDDCIEAGAVAAAGQHADSHEGHASGAAARARSGARRVRNADGTSAAPGKVAGHDLLRRRTGRPAARRTAWPWPASSSLSASAVPAAWADTGAHRHASLGKPRLPAPGRRLLAAGRSAATPSPRSPPATTSADQRQAGVVSATRRGDLHRLRAARTGPAASPTATSRSRATS